MDEIKFTIDHAQKDMRIDKCIALKLGEDGSRTYVKTLMEKGMVQVNGGGVKPSYVTKEGDEVRLETLPPEAHNLEPEDIPLNIIYEDEHVIIVDKPYGMVVHPACGNWNGTLVNALLHHCGGLPESGDGARPGLVHRLDKDTSGVMVVAKDDKTMRSLAKQFQKRAVKKKYIALVEGQVEFDNGVVDIPIARHPVDRKKMAVAVDAGKEARTMYHVIQRYKKFTHIVAAPETGRTHQIRVHMEYLGHPVLGDKTYGSRVPLKRQALHARSLGFTHPFTSEYMEFNSPVPDDIMEVIRKAENE